MSEELTEEQKAAAKVEADRLAEVEKQKALETELANLEKEKEKKKTDNKLKQENKSLQKQIDELNEKAAEAEAKADEAKKTTALLELQKLNSKVAEILKDDSFNDIQTAIKSLKIERQDFPERDTSSQSTQSKGIGNYNDATGKYDDEVNYT